MTRRHHSAHRMMVGSGTLLVQGCCLVASSALAFLAVVVHPAFLVFVFGAIAVGVAVTVLGWRALERIDQAAAQFDEASTAAEAAPFMPKPFSARRHLNVKRWLRHARRRVREGSQR